MAADSSRRPVGVPADWPHTRHTGAAPDMRALCARRLARSGLLPGLMRLAGGASVALTLPPLRAAEVRITPAPLQESRPARQQDGRRRVSLRAPNAPGPGAPG